MATPDVGMIQPSTLTDAGAGNTGLLLANLGSVSLAKNGARLNRFMLLSK